MDLINSLHAGYFFHDFCLLLIIYLESTFLKNCFQNLIRVTNILNPDQAQQKVRPDLGPNCLQRLFADDKSRDNKAKS